MDCIKSVLAYLSLMFLILSTSSFDLCPDWKQRWRYWDIILFDITWLYHLESFISSAALFQSRLSTAAFIFLKPASLLMTKYWLDRILVYMDVIYPLVFNIMVTTVNKEIIKNCFKKWCDSQNEWTFLEITFWDELEKVFQKLYRKYQLWRL